MLDVSSVVCTIETSKSKLSHQQINGKLSSASSSTPVHSLEPRSVLQIPRLTPKVQEQLASAIPVLVKLFLLHPLPHSIPLVYQHVYSMMRQTDRGEDNPF